MSRFTFVYPMSTFLRTRNEAYCRRRAGSSLSLGLSRPSSCWRSFRALHRQPGLLLHLVNLVPDLGQLRPDTLEVLQFFQGHMQPLVARRDDTRLLQFEGLLGLDQVLAILLESAELGLEMASWLVASEGFSDPWTGLLFSQSARKSAVRASTARSSATTFICRLATWEEMAVSLRRIISVKADHSPSTLSTCSHQLGNWKR
uniref:Uncharacterized protein n=1 Tax=Rhipicephalus microplus TaxID=6941 RepID=A0A6G5AH14_RHIMP